MEVFLFSCNVHTIVVGLEQQCNQKLYDFATYELTKTITKIIAELLLIDSTAHNNLILTL